MDGRRRFRGLHRGCLNLPTSSGWNVWRVQPARLSAPAPLHGRLSCAGGFPMPLPDCFPGVKLPVCSGPGFCAFDRSNGQRPLPHVMAAPNQQARTNRWVALLGVTAVTVYLSWKVLEPFVEVLILGIALTVIFQPVHRR